MEIQALPPQHLLAERHGDVETSTDVARRVAAARQIQMRRQGLLNARLNIPEAQRWCRLDTESRALLGAAIARLNVSARAHDRILKIARTCADLAGEGEVRAAHVAEALSLRGYDRGPTPALQAQAGLTC